MNELTKKLKETTLGEVFHAVKDLSLSAALLSFTGVLTIVRLVSALFAALRNDSKKAERSLGTAFVCLLINILLTVLTSESEAENAEDRG